MNVYESRYEGYDMHRYGWSIVIAANSIDEAYRLANKTGYVDENLKLKLINGLIYNLPNPTIISSCYYYCDDDL